MPHGIFGVIMAGGRGTRFWPVSTRALPKQFLRLVGDRTMLQATADRFDGLLPREDLIVVTGCEHAGTVMEQLPWLDRSNLLLEPEGRNTAACIGWAAEVLRSRGFGSSLMAVVPSDHVMETDEGFRETLRAASIPASEGRLMTIGVSPDRPSSAYGYLMRGSELSPGVYDVAAFREKPDEETARGYLAAGCFYWNAGIFLWTADRILEEISLHLPRLAEGLIGMGGSLSPDAESYGVLPSVSIDYGVMEKAEAVAMVPARFSWSDVGDWPSARRCGVGRGRVIVVDSEDCTVWNEGRLTVLMGLKGVSVVETPSVTLVMSDEYSQELRKVVADLEEEAPELV
jgi:mannose-1-phosphate guanylyltransferase